MKRSLGSLPALLTLTGFAVAQPLYDLLGRHPEFFIARHASPLDLAALILILSVGVGAVLTLWVTVLGSMGAGVRRAGYRFVVAMLIALIALPVVNRVVASPGWLAVASALLIGIGGAWSFSRFDYVHKVAVWLWPTIVIFPVLFVLTTPVLDVVSKNKPVGADETAGQRTATASERPPIVMLLLDELPITSLLDATGSIDAALYPNFARLARDAHWFRNATTVADNTMTAIPALLTGTYPLHGKFATAHYYPDNLFTMLSPGYRLNVVETVTELCPQSLCPRSPTASGRLARFAAMLSDLSIVYLHWITPSDYAGALPPISNRWGDFRWSDSAAIDDRAQRAELMQQAQKERTDAFDQFVESIQASPTPTFHFLHLLLPHAPYNYLPSGSIYTLRSGIELSEDRAYQRHLLQVGFVDRLLGRLLERLEQLELYAPALLIVAADHGVSFRADAPRRALTDSNYQDLMAVPLLVKLPFQEQGTVSDANVQTIDIVPSVASLLDIEPYPTDGSSFFDHLETRGHEKVVYSGQGRQKRSVSIDELRNRRSEALQHKLALMGGGRFPVFGFGSTQVIDRPLSAFRVTVAKELSMHLDQGDLLGDIDTGGAFVPGYLSGRLTLQPGAEIPSRLVVSINDTVWLETQVENATDREATFAAIVPATAFVDGPNTVRLFVPGDDPQDGRTLREVRTAADRARFTLRLRDPGEWVIESSDGETITIDDESLQGWVGQVRVYDDFVNLVGWAADVETPAVAERIVIFNDGEFLLEQQPNIVRDDVAAKYGDRRLRSSGFSIELSRSVLRRWPRPVVRVFALSGSGMASELQYPSDFPWRE